MQLASEGGAPDGGDRAGKNSAIPETSHTHPHAPTPIYTLFQRLGFEPGPERAESVGKIEKWMGDKKCRAEERSLAKLEGSRSRRNRKLPL